MCCSTTSFIMWLTWTRDRSGLYLTCWTGMLWARLALTSSTCWFVYCWHKRQVWSQCRGRGGWGWQQPPSCWRLPWINSTPEIFCLSVPVLAGDNHQSSQELTSLRDPISRRIFWKGWMMKIRNTLLWVPTSPCTHFQRVFTCFPFLKGLVSSPFYHQCHVLHRDFHWT